MGDQVSFEVIPLEDANLDGYQVSIQVDGSGGQKLGPEKFGRFGIGGRTQATLMWAWDTQALEPGVHRLEFSLLPGGPSWTQAVWLEPRSALPPALAQAHWAEAQTDCCVVHYITGTAAERDLPALLEMLNAQAQDASRRTGEGLSQPFEITFLPRVLGQGGFASQEIAISYLDRNYAGDDPPQVVHHEMIHILDLRQKAKFRPTLLVEGLAVYLSGGHFKPEPLIPRAAALLPPGAGCQAASPAGDGRPVCSLGWYLPLEPLANSFYLSQHEIGYLEAGSLVQYMVETWGWDAYLAFYHDIPDPQNGDEAQAMDTALQAHFGLSFSELERRFISALREQQLTSQQVEDVRLTVHFYDAVRRYQRILDPSAYFLTAWLPDPQKMRQRGIVADYLRQPDAPENVALETLLVSADQALREADYTRSQQLLDAVNNALTVFDSTASELPGVQLATPVPVPPR